MARSLQRQAKASPQGRGVPLDASERRKMIILVALGVVCVVVVLVQVLKSHGPSEAEATAMATDAQSTDLSSVVDQMRATLEAPKVAGTTVFSTVDEALQLFLGGAKPEAVPLAALPQAVFGMPAPDDSEGAVSMGPDAAVVSGLTGTSDPVASQLAAINLETVLVSPASRAAIIDGQVYRAGQTINGFVIESIDTGRVTMVRGGRRYVLKLD